MKKINRFLYGFLPGLLLPILFLFIYLKQFYPVDITFIEILKQLYPSVMLGKLFLLSIVPNLVAVFIFYKQDNFKIGIGVMVGALPYLIAAMFMM